jgi:hypothetical protein
MNKKKYHTKCYTCEKRKCSRLLGFFYFAIDVGGGGGVQEFGWEEIEADRGMLAMGAGGEDDGTVRRLIDRAHSAATKHTSDFEWS